MRIARLDGLLVFDIVYPSPFARIRRQMLLEQMPSKARDLGRAGDALFKNMCHMIAVTREIEVKGEGEAFDALRRFWDMARDPGTPVEALFEVFGGELHGSIYDAWFTACDEADKPLVPVDQRPPAALTEEERADPLS